MAIGLMVLGPEMPLGWTGDQAFVLGGMGTGSKQPRATQRDGRFPLGFNISGEEGSNSLCLPAAALGMLLVYLIREMKK